MSRRLAALRRSLDVMPSPVEDRPGLLLRDPLGYTEDVVIIPAPVVPFLRLFDGRHDEDDLAAAFVRATGEIGSAGLARNLSETLDGRGFLENEELERRRETRHRAFADAVRREAAHAGTAYPDDARELASFLEEGLAGGEDGAEAPPDAFAVAAPHVSLEGGWRSYASAYRALPGDAADRLVVVLGTSHYGRPERFGLTRKPYVTPFGPTTTDTAVVERLVAQGGEGVVLEDYCHAIEHSIEFQVLFLQHRLGGDVRLVPILCGPFARATSGPGRPEDDPGVARFIDALAELDAREGGRILWVLAVDMAHVGARYGDPFEARVGEERLAEVERRDRLRLEAIAAGDADRFWELVREREDDLKWCGAYRSTPS